MIFVNQQSDAPPPMNGCDYTVKVNYRTWRCMTAMENKSLPKAAKAYAILGGDGTLSTSTYIYSTKKEAEQYRAMPKVQRIIRILITPIA